MCGVTCVLDKKDVCECREKVLEQILFNTAPIVEKVQFIRNLLKSQNLEPSWVNYNPNSKTFEIKFPEYFPVLELRAYFSLGEFLEICKKFVEKRECLSVFPKTHE